MANPTLKGLLPRLLAQPSYQELTDDLTRNPLIAGDEPLTVGLPGAARPYVAAALRETLQRPLLIITVRPEVALQMQAQIEPFLSSNIPLLNFPDPGALPYERAAWSHDRVQRRLTALTALLEASEGNANAPIIVTSARALLYPTIPPELFQRHQRRYNVGQQVNLRFLLAAWHAMGYVNTSMVLEAGQMAQRGGILDIFPPNQLQPLRVELWGDEIDSIRAFDPISQRSERQLKAVTIPPASEALLHRTNEQAAERLNALTLDGVDERMQALFREDFRRIAEGERFDTLEFYLPYLYPKSATLFDHLPPDALLIVDDWDSLQLNVSQVEDEALRLHEDLIQRGELPRDIATLLYTWDDLRDLFSQQPPLILGYAEAAAHPLGEQFVVGDSYGGRLHEAMQRIQSAQNAGTTQLMLTRQAERMVELLHSEGVDIVGQQAEVAAPLPNGSLVVVNGALAEGFELKAAPDAAAPLAHTEFHLITDSELFGWSRTVSRRPLRAIRRKRSDLFDEIREGSHVVHIEHGIGIYRGLVQREIGGVTREYLFLEYDQGDKLFVPVHQADRVVKYLGPDGRDPNVHRLGTGDWDRVRRRTKQAVEYIAEELLELYARRATVKGYAFGPDTPWQAELEASFPFIETEDQVEAIQSVKADMENVQPMDRLIVGDVGFGKTEVALRAAFKAVMDGKQVAMLVPTTVLAQQHDATFRQRLAPYPVVVEMLSRFRTAKEQSEIIERLSKGQVDIVIGTHRLLSQDIEFKDLGLIIVDEEQRFGVTHKERLKQLRSEVDVLTLTATPIPRTLHMALTGARDMSTIETPPQERLPVTTEVARWDDSLVQRAIMREIDRGGQVFLVHNRVLSIHAMAERVRKLVPEAQVAVGHGQLNEHQLEQVMIDFAEGRYDVLVCTSIIESGLDLPNVNTIIVDRSDMFGLAQLYQLRGRVGRSARRGYAYFLHPHPNRLTQEALDRLEVMRETTELGAGFRVAMRDLEIRGAGDLLGAQQSGHIAAVGFDMYTRLLEQAIRQRKAALVTAESNEAPSDDAPIRADVFLESSAAVDLPLEAHLAPDYIADDEVRLEIYRRMAQAQREADVEEIEQTMRDRFGPLPEAAQQLLYILRLRLLATKVGVTQITIETSTSDVIVQFPGPQAIRAIRQGELLNGRVRYGRRELYVDRDDEDWQTRLMAVLSDLVHANEGA